MAEPLAPLLADGVIDAVISRLKSGKEADIFLVEHNGEVVAAKVYKEREARNFRNNAAYKEGRQVRNSRTQRAMEKGSKFGLAASEDAWKQTETDALQLLHSKGVRVPQPVIFYEGVLLMELVIDAEGHPAPRLIDAHVPFDVAAPFYADLRSQVVKMLTCDLIHGDLSPYNIMLAWNGPTIIDFPQVVGASHNSQAFFFFERDLGTLQKFFAEIDPSLQKHHNDAKEIWRAYEKGELTEDFVPTGRFVESGPRREYRNDRPPREPKPQQQNGRREDRPRGPQAGGGNPRADGQQGRRNDRGGQPDGRGDRGQQPRGERGPQSQNASAPQPRNDRGSQQPRRDGQQNPNAQQARGEQQARRDGQQNQNGQSRGDQQARRDGQQNPNGQQPRGDQQARRDGQQNPNGQQPRGDQQARRDGQQNPASQHPRGEQQGRRDGQQNPNGQRPRGDQVGRDGQQPRNDRGPQQPRKERGPQQQRNDQGPNAPQGRNDRPSEQRNRGPQAPNGEPRNDRGGQRGRDGAAPQGGQRPPNGPQRGNDRRGQERRPSGPQVSYVARPASANGDPRSDSADSSSRNGTDGQ